MPSKSAREYLKEKSTESLLNMPAQEFASLTDSQLRGVVSRISDAANKRLNRLDKSGIWSPAKQTVENQGGNFSTKGKSVPELKAEFLRVKEFMRDRTSTVKGATEFQKEFRETYRDMYDDAGNVDFDEIPPEILEKNVFNTLHRLRELNPGMSKKEESDLIRRVREMVEENPYQTVDDLVASLQDELISIYEEQRQNDTDFNTSAFFDG